MKKPKPVKETEEEYTTRMNEMARLLQELLRPRRK